MVKILMLGAVFVAALNATCGDVLTQVFSQAIKDRIAIIETVTSE